MTGWRPDLRASRGPHGHRWMIPDGVSAQNPRRRTKLPAGRDVTLIGTIARLRGKSGSLPVSIIEWILLDDPASIQKVMSEK